MRIKGCVRDLRTNPVVAIRILDDRKIIESSHHAYQY